MKPRRKHYSKYCWLVFGPCEGVCINYTWKSGIRHWKFKPAGAIKISDKAVQYTIKDIPPSPYFRELYQSLLKNPPILA